MLQVVIVNDEFLRRVQKSKVIVIDKRDNYFDEQGKKQDTPLNMVFRCMAIDPEISKIKFSIKTKINDIKVGDIVRVSIEKASVYALTKRDVQKNTMVPIRVSLKGQLTKVVDNQ
ncbi:hypothetical protein [Limosilactobacillus reuteri]|uniref:hypothetical protein n=1 Tax=Limosilactobacillus reuteri TaxID=1598 RepID=UPI00232E0FDB|nr:hypothetical protein [Limosilactobacillus reuteri]